MHARPTESQEPQSQPEQEIDRGNPTSSSRAALFASHVGRFAWPGAFVAIAAMGFGYLREPAPKPQDTTSEIRVDHTGATIVRELRALSRLETGMLRVEKVIEIKDHQKHLHGLVDADDSLLFVAAGEVVLGVDLSKLSFEEGEAASTNNNKMFDPKTGIATIELPEPEVLSTRFDEKKSYVHARSTDVFARRNEALESSARREALAAFAAAGKDAQAIDAAKAQAEKQLRGLAKAWGAKDLIVTWRAARGEVDVAAATAK